MTQVNHLATAWDWLLRLREETVTQSDLAEWLRWYEADEQHKRAFEKVQAFWSSLEGLQGPGTPRVAEVLCSASPSEISREARPRFNRRAVRFAAAFLLALAAGVIVPRGSRAPRLSLPVVESPPVVEHSVLPDGSRVELAPRSRLEVRFTAKERTVEIGDGEAYFSVAHNRARPFLVHVGSLSVRAVGTAFNVRKAASRVVVTVSEGIVEVSAAGAGRPLRVSAGQQLTSAEGQKGASSVAPADLPLTLAWRQGRLDFLNEPLAGVIADVNRYRERPIVIRDESVGRILFSGTVLAAQVEVWVQALPQVFPVQLTTGEHGESILAERAPPHWARTDGTFK